MGSFQCLGSIEQCRPVSALCLQPWIASRVPPLLRTLGPVLTLPAKGGTQRPQGQLSVLVCALGQRGVDPATSARAPAGSSTGTNGPSWPRTSRPSRRPSTLLMAATETAAESKPSWPNAGGGCSATSSTPPSSPRHASAEKETNDPRRVPGQGRLRLEGRRQTARHLQAARIRLGHVAAARASPDGRCARADEAGGSRRGGWHAGHRGGSVCPPQEEGWPPVLQHLTADLCQPVGRRQEPRGQPAHLHPQALPRGVCRDGGLRLRPQA